MSEPLHPYGLNPIPAAPLTEREREPYLAAIAHGKPALGDWDYPRMLKRLLARYDVQAAQLAAYQQQAETYAGECGRLRWQVEQARAEAATAEAEKLQAFEALRKLRAAITKASAPHLSAAEREAYASNTNGQGTRGAFGAGEIMGRVALAQDLLALLDAPAPEGKEAQGE